MQTIELLHNNGTCRIIIKPGLINAKLLNQYKTLANRFVIISDENVGPLYTKTLLAQFADKQCELIMVKTGEESKSRETKADVEDKMFSLGYGRDTAIIAVGGGIVTDLAGFIAATYCRGISSIYVPTTLLAMVDAAIGGKTGINTSFGKNLIGSFYQPYTVLCDINTLSTLPLNELANGLVETVKHALIADRDFFSQLNQWLDKLKKKHKLDNADLERLITRSCQIKCDIVTADEKEQGGLRQLLNFGHTIAHGIERLKQYNVSHGQAVLVGLWVECCLSHFMGYLTAADFYTIKQVLKKIHFSTPIQLSSNDFSKLKHHLLLDKKSINQKARFVLLNAIGEPHIENNQYSFAVDDEFLDTALQLWLKEHR